MLVFANPMFFRGRVFSECATAFNASGRLCCKLCHKSHLRLGQTHLCCELFLQPGHCFSHDTRPNAEGPLNHALLTNGIAGQIVRPSLTFS